MIFTFKSKEFNQNRRLVLVFTRTADSLQLNAENIVCLDFQITG